MRMKTRSLDTFPLARLSQEPTLPRGTGFVMVGLASLMMWAMIAGVATIL